MTEFSEAMLRRAAEGSRMLGAILEVADAHFRHPGGRMAEVADLVDLVRHSNIHSFDYEPEGGGRIVRQDFALTDVPENWDGTLAQDRITLIPYLDEVLDEVDNPEFGPDRIGVYTNGCPVVSMRRLDSSIGQGLLGMFEYSVACADRQQPLPRFDKDAWDDMDVVAWVSARLRASTLVVDTLSALDESGSTTEWVSAEANKRSERGMLTNTAGAIVSQQVRIPLQAEPVAAPPAKTAAAELWSDPTSQLFIADNIVAIGLANSTYREEDFAFLGTDEPLADDQAVRHRLSIYRASQVLGLYWQAAPGIKY